MSTPITPENCNILVHEYMQDDFFGDKTYRSAAWSLIYNFCLQHGMEKLPYPSSGIETVITFIDNLIKNK